MTDRRLHPTNGRVAARELEGTVSADRFVDGVTMCVGASVADLCAAPDGPRDRQVLFGERVRVLETVGAHAFVQADKDGYVGYLDHNALMDPFDATHVVCVPSTHLLERPKVQAPNIRALPFLSRIRIVSGAEGYFETHDGLFVPRGHVRPANRPFEDPTTVAQLFFGAPYLWGGNTVWGLDCSGLVQAALIACGHTCPGDSDMQMTLGRPAESPFKRGDLLFWTGHVAICVDAQVLIHANAFTMSVAYEEIQPAIDRIAEQGDGPVKAHRRL
ncbi:MAG: C40 family peptidase [Rhodobacteraceae bacterium]|nr:C40 family peptidase [Paracoccaceae bacterium]